MAQSRRPQMISQNGGGNRVYPTKAVDGPDIADFDPRNGEDIPDHPPNDNWDMI